MLFHSIVIFMLPLLKWMLKTIIEFPFHSEILSFWLLSSSSVCDLAIHSFFNEILPTTIRLLQSSVNWKKLDNCKFSPFLEQLQINESRFASVWKYGEKKDLHLKWNILTPISRSRCALFDCFVILWCFSKHRVYFEFYIYDDLQMVFSVRLVFACFCAFENCVTCSRCFKQLSRLITMELWIPKPLNAFDPHTHTYTRNHKQFNARSHFI